MSGKVTDYQSGDCNEDAVKGSQKIGSWKKSGQLQSEENISDRYSKDQTTE